MEKEDIIYFSDRSDWRLWLRENHNTRDFIWLLYYKKHTCRPRIQYDDAVEEAICYGWIDSIIKKVDEISYCQKFTPRKSGSRWSESNIQRAEALIKAGLMTESGLALYKEVLDNPGLILETPDNSRDLSLPQELKDALKIRKKAREYFLNSTRSYRNMCIRWIETAKKPETRCKRASEVAEKSAREEKIGLK